MIIDIFIHLLIYLFHYQVYLSICFTVIHECIY